MPEETKCWTEMKTGDIERLETETAEWTGALLEIRGAGG